MIGAVEIERDPKRAFAPAGGWDELLGRSPADSIFLSARWLKVAHEVYAGALPFVAAHCTIDGKRSAQAAFFIDGTTARFVGDGPCDYLDFILDRDLAPAEAMQRVAELVEAVAHAVPQLRRWRLRNLRERLGTPANLRALAGWEAVELRSTIAPAMSMDAAADAVKKKSLKRHENGLAKLGALTCETMTEPAEILPRLDDFFAQHIGRWRDTQHPSLFLDERHCRFYRQLVQEFADPAAPRSLRFTEIRLAGTLAAAHFGASQGGVFTWYKPSFAAALREHSPGEVLLKRLIERAMAEQCKVFDFTIGDEAFKNRFATESPRVVDLLLTRSSWESQSVRWRLAFKTMVKALLRRVGGVRKSSRT